jgi:hypothetical protein
MRLTGHVGYKTSVEKSEKSKPLKRPKHRRDIKINLKAGLLRIRLSDIHEFRIRRDDLWYYFVNCL